MQKLLVMAAALCCPLAVNAAQYGDFTYSSSGTAITITAYTGAGGNVAIPEIIEGLPVTTVGEAAFESIDLTNVSIPSSVTSIGQDAFAYTGLTNVTVPASVTNLGDGAFFACAGLASVTISDGVASIGGQAFACTGLTHVTVPGSVTNLGDGAFWDCSKLASVTILPGLLRIGDATFHECINLGDITIPGSATSIGATAFEYCTNLASVAIPEGVLSIADQAFAYCTGLTNVTIPGSVTNLGTYAFSHCSSLLAIAVETTNAAYSSVEGVLFNKTRNALILFPAGIGVSYAIPNGTTSIGEGAFRDCSMLAEVTIPGGVTNLGNYAFCNCISLTNVTIPTGVTSLGDRAFSGCTSLTAVLIPGSVANVGLYAFCNCTNLASVTIFNGVTGIGEQAFYGCTSLTGVMIPGSVASIGISAFYNCANLTSLTISNGLGRIAYAAFASCPGLTNVTIPGSVTNLGGWAFGGCARLSAINVEPVNAFYSSVDGVLFNKSQTTLIQCPEGKAGSFTLPGNTINIENYAFYDCHQVTNVMIGSSLALIGDYAFSGARLTSLFFKGNAPSLGAYVFTFGMGQPTIAYYLEGTTGWGANFGGCPTVALPPFTYTTNNGAITLTGYIGPGGAVVIPGTINGLPVTSIGGYAFSGGAAVTNLTLPASITSFAAYAFNDCPSLAAIWVNATNVSYSSLNGVLFNKSQTTLIQCPEGWAGGYAVPDGVTSVATRAFYQCASLTGVTFPGSLTSIGARAFYECSSLTNIFIPGSVTSIADGPFPYCYTLMNITVDDTNPAYRSVDGVLLDKSVTTLIQYPGGRSGSYTIPGTVSVLGIRCFGGSGLSEIIIPGSVTTIRDYAFNTCGTLTNITIPSSVTSIGVNYVFAFCPRLVAITVDAGNAIYSSADGVLFDWVQATLIQCPLGRAGKYAIPGGVTSIAVRAFYQCDRLASVTVPASLTAIASYAFQYCTSLTGVFFCGNAPSAGTDVFLYTDNATIYYLPGATGWGATFAGRPTALWSLPAPFALGVRQNGAALEVGLFGELGRSYTIESATNLTQFTAWTNLVSTGTNWLAVPVQPQQFFRGRAALSDAGN